VTNPAHRRHAWRKARDKRAQSIRRVDDISLVWSNIGEEWVAELRSGERVFGGRGGDVCEALRTLVEDIEE
jgi:hypothetical protein